MEVRGSGNRRLAGVDRRRPGESKLRSGSAGCADRSGGGGSLGKAHWIGRGESDDDLCFLWGGALEMQIGYVWVKRLWFGGSSLWKVDTYCTLQSLSVILHHLPFKSILRLFVLSPHHQIVLRSPSKMGDQLFQ